MKADDGVVRMLLEQNDIDPDLMEKDGLTPLLITGQSGHVEVLGILQGQNNFNPNIGD